MLSVNEIIDFFKLNNSHAKRELGQNFLVNKDAIIDIVDALEINENDKVMEIGPGLGALTDEIINKATNYTVVEYDAKFVDFLTREYGDRKNFTVVKNNILKVREFDGNKVIGNLPYYITTDILEHIILNYKNLTRGVFMVQKECLERITALSGKDYNAINVVIKYLFDLKIIRKVKRDCFFPEPNVDSVVFKIEKQEKNGVSAAFLYKIAKICFSNRRKTLFNNLGNVIKDKTKVRDLLNECKLKETARAEELSVNDFVTLSNAILKCELIAL